MAKKSVNGDTAKKPKALSNRELQFALIENFVGMQKVLTNLTYKFDALSNNISRLLELFEISAKTFIRKQEDGVGDDKSLIRKLDTLLDQNQTIAKGLTLIEEKIRHKAYPAEEISQILGGTTERPRPRPFPKV